MKIEKYKYVINLTLAAKQQKFKQKGLTFKITQKFQVKLRTHSTYASPQFTNNFL